MKKLSSTGLAMSLFFLITLVIVVWMSYTRPRVFILHSYSEEYIWTREVNVGLDRVLADQGWMLVRYHFMKTKKFRSREAHRRAGIAARNAIDRFRPDILIAVDDYAQELVARQYLDRPDMRIVFAGVNGGIEPYGYAEADNVTGILERKPLAAIKEVLLLLADDNPSIAGGKALRTLFLSDPALSGKRDAACIDGFDWHPIDHRGSIQVEDFTQWQEAVRTADRVADFLLVSGYRKLRRSADASGFVPAGEVMRWTEANSPVPVIGLNFFNTGDGAMLSVGVSPYEQGEVAATMALDLLRGRKKISDLPVRTSQQYIISLRAPALEKRHIRVPKIFEAFARATNTYFDTPDSGAALPSSRPANH